MNQQEREEYAVLKFANEAGVFAVQLGLALSVTEDLDMQLGLDRMLRRGWVTLIDVSAIAPAPDRLFRVFLAGDEAMRWFREHSQ